ncbi:aldo/keto reductase [Candidatus Zixiibacteriota bacterium]
MGSKSRFSRRGFMKSSGMAMVGSGIVAGRPMPVRGEEQGQDLKIHEYRTLGRTGFEVSDISFGTGTLNNANVLQVALDMGVNYIDTAEHYVGGQAERSVGEALRGRDRSKIFLTTKLNLTFGGGSTREALKERFQQCLGRLQTDYADCLMIHMTPEVEQVRNEEFHAAYQELKADGKVRFLGLSNHGMEQSWWGKIDVPMEAVLGAAVEDGRFDVALFVYNFLQKDQGESIIEMCKSRGMGVTLMKTDPINLYANIQNTLTQTEQSGRRISESRAQMAQAYEEYISRADAFKSEHGIESEQDARSAAIRFCLDNSDVHCVCPSINTFDELENFVSLSGQKLTLEDEVLLAGYEGTLGQYYCRHACGVCEPSCPHQVPVNTIMRYNHYFDAHGREKHAMQKFAHLKAADSLPCLDCPGHCESACPHEVPVRSLLVHAQNNLSLD